MERKQEENKKIAALIASTERAIIGKREIIKLIITAMLSGGHVLIEDVPGVGKTKLASAIAASCGGKFNRIQMTPDVMPSDITGFTLFNQTTRNMEFKQGAAFCNFLLADEINRSSPKSQSALLEVMEEKHISVDGVTYGLPDPFMVLATQNPVETYGTYHLPEAQMDRFLMKLSMGYPGKDNEIEMLKRSENPSDSAIGQVLSIEDILELKKEVKAVFCSDRIENYIVEIAEKTRNTEGILLGVSPRGSLALFDAVKAYAYVSGRSYVLPDDVKNLAGCVLSHRMLLTPQGKTKWNDTNTALNDILNMIEVPTQ